MGRKTKARFGTATLCALGAILALAASAPAATVFTHPFASSLTPPPSATPKGAFAPAGIAVNQANGKVYVADKINRVVDIFSAAGAYLGQLDDSGAPFRFSFYNTFQGVDGFGPDVAVDNSGGPTAGRVYVTTQGHGDLDHEIGDFPPSDVYAFGPGGAYLPGFAPSNSAFGPSLPCGLAVDSDGNVAVGAVERVGVTVLDPGAAELSSVDTSGFLGLGPNMGPAPACGLAYDATGALYARSLFTNLVAKFNPAGEFEYLLNSAAGAAPSASAYAVETDRSSGEVYVDDDRGGFIAQYDSSGSLVGQFGLTKLGESTAPAGISLSESSGQVYVADPVHERVAVFGPASSLPMPDILAEAASAVADTSATLNGSINPQGLAAQWRFQFKRHKTKVWSQTDLQGASGSSAIAISTPIAGLAQHTIYDFRVQAIDTTTGALISSNVASFTTDGLPQANLTIDPASALTPTSAHLTGTIDPNGSEAKWRFQYTTDDTFEEDWKDVGVEAEAGSGSSPVPVSADLGGLSANTHYFVRLVGTNAGGSRASAQIELTTLPTVPLAWTRPAAVSSETATTLGGVVNPQHAPTTYFFEYGPTDSYGSSFPPGQDASAGSGVKDTLVRQHLEGLQPATEYHYRLAARNGAGTVYGEDMTFETVDPADGPPRRGIELVSNPDKGNQNILSLAVSPNGDRVTWSTPAGAPGSPSGAQSLFLAERGAAGWRSHTLLPALGAGLAGDSANGYYLQRYNSAFDGFIAFALQGVVSVRGADEVLVRLDDAGHQTILHTFPTPTSFVARDGARNGFDASADLSKVFAATNERISPAQVPGTFGLYEFGSGTPLLVSRLPDNSVPTCGVEAGQSAGPFSGFFTSVGTTGPTGNGEGEWPDWIATTDGSRAFFASAGTGNCSVRAQLYQRNLESSSTTLISGPPLAGPLGQPQLLRVAADGRTAIFLTAARLLGEDTDEGRDVYRWSEDAPLQCLTCGGPPAEVLEAQAAVSRDLSHVYFLSRSQLVPGEGRAGEENLYVWHGGQVDYVGHGAPLSDDSARPIGWKLTPDGSFLLFQGRSDTTVDETGDGALYLYDDGNGRVSCVSCKVGGPTAGGASAAEARLSPDGQTVIFNSVAALLRRDVNHGPDLYEWHGGQVELITDGVRHFGSSLFSGGLGVDGISDDARDVIFRAGAKLTPEVQDPYVQVYDARAGGGFPAPESPPAPCEGDACQGPLTAPPPLGQPGSSTLSGPGNARAQRSGHKTKTKKQHRKHRGKAKHRGRGTQATGGGRNRG